MYSQKMNKKFLIIISLVFITLLKSQTTFGFLSDDLGLDLYKKIDSWVYDLEMRYVDKELKWWDVNGSIVEELKKIEWLWELSSCFDLELSSQETRKIASWWDESIALLYEKLEKCAQDWKISQQTISNYQDLIENYYAESVASAEEKVKQIHKIARIWLYSDWIEENSPFDLMKDIEEIDKIIFETTPEYNWVNIADMDKIMDWMLNWQLFEDWWLVYGSYDKDDYNWNSSTLTTPIEVTDWSNMVCKVNDTKLNDETINDLLKDKWINVIDYPNNDEYLDDEEYWNDVFSYQAVNDNAMWPCNNFFCITIEFVTYTHNLLWWWTSPSIEWFIKKSNEHLKKFSSTSLVQSKMTTNIFEMWLKDLNLADTFHIWVQVSHKPVPILNLEKEDDEGFEDKWDGSDFSVDNLLHRYYTNLWLDYERQNDLEVFKWEDYEFKSMLNKTQLASQEAEINYNEYKEYTTALKLQNDYISETVIDKKILSEEISWFYNQFIELESFVEAMMDYSINLSWIIKKMREIPIGN